MPQACAARADHADEMRRLRDFQPVLLQAGEAGWPCRVVARQDAEAVLLPDDPAAADLPDAEMRATLSLERDGHPALLHGVADRGPLEGTVRFAVLDPTSVPDPRRAPRMPLDVAVLVKAANVPLPVCARTVDVSRGGMQLAGFSAPAGTAVCVLLALPGSDGRLQLDGRVVRGEAGRAGIAFDAEAQEVADFVLRCRGMLAGQLAERAAQRAAALSGR